MLQEFELNCKINFKFFFLFFFLYFRVQMLQKKKMKTLGFTNDQKKKWTSQTLKAEWETEIEKEIIICPIENEYLWKL